MTCFHITQIKEELRSFNEKFKNENSFLYKKLSSVVNEEDIGTELIETQKGGLFSSSKYKAAATYETYDFSYVSKEVLIDLLKKIEKPANECKCYESSSKEGNELKNKLTVTDDKLKDKCLESKGYETQVVSLRESKKEVKDDLNSLQEQLLGKTRELAEKDTEIVSLREQLIELLERELDDLEVEEEQAGKMRRLYRQFFQAKETRNKEEAENEIIEIRKELKEKIGTKNSRAACEKCKQLAKLDVQLEQQQNEREQQRASVLVLPRSNLN